MLFATSTNVTVYAFYASGLTGKTGLTVKVSVNRNGTVISGLAVSDAVAATEVDATNQPGLYSYTLSSSNDATEGAYTFHFYTTDTTVNAQHIESLIYCFAWVGYINGAGGNLNSGKTGYSLSGTQTFNVTGNITGNLSGSVGSVLGNVAGSVASVVGNVGGNVVGSVGSVLATVNATVTSITAGVITAASFAANALDAVLDRATSTLTVVGSFGKWVIDNITEALGGITAIGSETWSVTSPTSVDGDDIVLRLTVGDDYYAADGRGISFVVPDGYSDLTGATAVLTLPPSITLTATSVDNDYIKFDAPRAQTTYLNDGNKQIYEIKVTLSGGHIARPIIGPLIVTEGLTK
jgi:hypothetical protein